MTTAFSAAPMPGLGGASAHLSLNSGTSRPLRWAQSGLKEPRPEALQHDLSRSRVTTPRPDTQPLQCRTPSLFAQDASLVLIGLPGSGVSSLAVITSKALRWKTIDASQDFWKRTGYSRAEYRKSYGLSHYYTKEKEVLQELLGEYSRNTVIAYGPISTGSEAGVVQVLQDFAREHPVVFVLRDAAALAKYLGTTSSQVKRLKAATCGIYRRCSSIDFYNYSQEPVPHAASACSSRSPSPNLGTPYLTLKDLEQDFLRLLDHVYDNKIMLSNIVSSFPLSSIPLSRREYTRALVLPLSRLEAQDVKIEDVEAGVDAIELVVDYGNTDAQPIAEYLDNIGRQYARLRRSTILPVVYNVIFSPAIDVHRMSHMKSLETYLELVYHGLRLCSDYVTINLDNPDCHITPVMTTRGSTLVIGTQDTSSLGGWDSEAPARTCLRALRLGCAAVRLSQPKVFTSDNILATTFANRMLKSPDVGSRIAVGAYNTGSLGRMSQCFNNFLTPVTHEDLRGRQSNLYGRDMITANEAQKALHAVFSIDSLHFSVIGRHVSHSLSPAMHNAAYKAIGLPHLYETCEIASFSEILPIIKHADFGGAAIALPYKVEIMGVEGLVTDEHAKAIGAVNTIVPLRREGENEQPTILYNRAGKVHGLRGINTDWIGIKNTVSSGLSPANAVSSATVALVIGAGGMARAAIYACINLGVRTIFMWNRTYEKAQWVVEHFRTRDLLRHHDDRDGDSRAALHILEDITQEWPAQIAPPPTMIVAAVAASSSDGRLLHHPSITIPQSWLASPTGGVLLDLAYRPVITDLLQQVRKPEFALRGWVTRDMLHMLPEQGYAQFEVATGRRAPRKVMRDAMMKAYRSLWVVEKAPDV